MREEDSTFGAEPQHLDRLIALGLEDCEDEAAGPQIEGPGTLGHREPIGSGVIAKHRLS